MSAIGAVYLTLALTGIIIGTAAFAAASLLQASHNATDDEYHR